MYFMKQTVKNNLALAALALGLVGLGGLFTWLFLVPQNSVPAPVAASEPPSAVPVPVITLPRLLDGWPVSSGEEVHPFVYAVIIDNNKEARPAAGLAEASIVFEAMAEGGIPRFLALFPATKILDKIGPVRSARPYFMEWAGEWGAAFVHSGGSPEALVKLSTNKTVINLDEFAQAPYFFRDRSRIAPHNLYTSSALLGRAGIDLNWPPLGNFLPWQFKEPALENERGDLTPPLQLRFYESAYTVEWRYDRPGNRYQRFQGGVPQVDESGQTIWADVILVQFLPAHVQDAIGRLQMKTVGHGEAKIFQDGKVVNGLWQKSTGGRTRFTDEMGQEVKLNRGQIWVEVRPKELPIFFKL